MTKKKLTGLRAKVAEVINASENWDHPDNEKYEEVTSALWRNAYFDSYEKKYYNLEEFDKWLTENHIVLSHQSEGREGYDEYGQYELSTVYRFANKEEECFVKFTGWSSSDSSCSEMSDWYFVKPVEKTIVVFEKE